MRLVCLYLIVLCLSVIACSKSPADTPTPTPPVNPPADTIPTTNPPTNPVNTDTVPTLVEYTPKGLISFGTVGGTQQLFINCINPDLSVRWTANLPGNIISPYSFVSNDHYIFMLTSTYITGNTRTNLTRMDPATGQILFQKIYDNLYGTSFTLKGDSVLIGGSPGNSTNGVIVIVDKNSGNLLSTTTLPGGYRPALMTVDGNKLYFQASTVGVTFRTMAYDLTNNSVIWSIPPPLQTINTDSKVFSYGGSLIAAGNGKVVAMSKADGSSIWSATVPGTTNYIYGNDRIYSFTENKLVALDAASGAGSWQWQNDTTMYSRGSFEGKNVFVMITQNAAPYYQFLSINTLTGKLYYRRALSKGFETVQAVGRYSYAFNLKDNIDHLGNKPTKLFKFDNRTGFAVDSAMVGYGYFGVAE